MKRAVLALALVGALTSCRFIPGTQASEIAEAQKAVSYQLRDPDSAKFRDEWVIGRGDDYIVCGQVNGKNGVGAYDGFVPYEYSARTKSVQLLPAQDGSNSPSSSALNFPIFCLPKMQHSQASTDAASQDSEDLNAAANAAIADINKATVDADLRQAEKDAHEVLPGSGPRR